MIFSSGGVFYIYIMTQTLRDVNGMRGVFLFSFSFSFSFFSLRFGCLNLLFFVLGGRLFFYYSLSRANRLFLVSCADGT